MADQGNSYDRYLIGKTREEAAAAARNVDPQEVLRELKGLEAKFNHQAQDYQRMAKTASDAIALIEKTEQQKRALAEEASLAKAKQAAAQLQGTLQGAKKSSFAVFIDGSGSMNGTPIMAALDGAALLADAKPAVALWGEKQPTWITDKAQDPSFRVKVKQGLNLAVDLAPSVTEMHKLAAVNTLDRKKTHFILMSDGDLFDRQDARAAFDTLLSKNPKATVDVIIMGFDGTSMGSFVKELAAAWPDRVKQHVVGMRGGSGYTSLNEGTLSAGVQQAVMGIVAERLKPAAPRKKAAPTP